MTKILQREKKERGSHKNLDGEVAERINQGEDEGQKNRSREHGRKPRHLLGRRKSCPRPKRWGKPERKKSSSNLPVF